MSFQPKNEGIDHINIYSKSRLLLGRQLSNFYLSPFVVDKHGKFASVEAYWYWLSTGQKHEYLRNLSGFQAKQEGKKYEKVPIDNFENLILEAIRCKLRQNKEIRVNLKNSQLPFAHYYWYGEVDNPKIYYLEKYNWIIEEIERLRKLLQK